MILYGSIRLVYAFVLTHSLRCDNSCIHNTLVFTQCVRTIPACVGIDISTCSYTMCKNISCMCRNR